MSLVDVTFKEIAEIKRRILMDIILEYERNRMEGKGFDFYFVINTKIDELNKQIKD